MKKRLFLPLLGFLLFFQFNTSEAQVKQAIDSASKEFDFIKDDFIAASLDSIANLKYFDGFECASEKELKNIYGFEPGFIPTFTDSVYIARINKLNASTPINLTYNQYVRDYIELYAIKKRALTERVMGLAKIYFPLFEEHLDKFNMPLELKYLAIVESALNPEARSRVGATGLWQFMYGTGKMYDLNVTSFVDDRRDPIKSTIAACEHMNDLYKMYKDWLLVLAAYNSGAGNVNKAIRRSGGKMDFWQIRPFLPLETRGYVPAFIGVTYVMSYASEHNLRPVTPRIYHYEIDTVMVKDILTFKQISEYINVPVEDLQFLNPSYKAGVIPSTDGKTYTIRLPKKHIADFINNEAQLYALREEKNYEKEQIVTAMRIASQPEYHKVKAGENLGTISRKYKCSVNDLKKWNHLKSTNIAVGKKLIVRPETMVPVTQYAAAKKTEPKSQPKSEKSVAQSDTATELAVIDTALNKTKTTNSVDNVYYTVKSGETLNQIALKNGTTVNDIKAWNSLSGTIIHPGDKLIVAKKEISTTETQQLAEKNAEQKKKTTSQFKYYTVQRGDTLWTIAQKHEGCSVEDIKRLNDIRNEKSIQPGQKIKVGVI